MESPEKLWYIRPFEDGDSDFVISTMLLANRYSPDSLAMQVHKDKEAQKRYWVGCERLVQRLVEKTEVRVAEAIGPEGTKLIVGWVMGESDVICHYILSRRSFQKMGIAKDLLTPFLQAEGQVLYSFRPATKGIKIPEGWKYDSYCAWKWMK